MPYFLISLKFKSRPSVQVVREFPDASVELVFQKLHYKSQEKYGRELIYFNCVMLSKQSPEARAFIERKMKGRG
ncbi:hypothetical protein [Pollutibacter soli]|jgi:hypothetical protein|uniref:hypothetical protein n=1 Tax=Pollutibacter soli TaxID=3034157 RepID=UPI00301382B0